MTRDSKMTGQTCLRVRDNVHARQFQDELVVLDLVAGEYFSLDALGARVWGELSRGRTLGQVVDALAGDYDVEVSQLRADLLDFAEESRPAGADGAGDVRCRPPSIREARFHCCRTACGMLNLKEPRRSP